MDRRAKTLVLATAILFSVLLIKSLWIDPVGNLAGDQNRYGDFALEAAAAVHHPIVLKPPVITYRLIEVSHEASEGEITKILINEGGNSYLEELEGKYAAKVRIYFLGVFPYRDIKIEGGIE
ncbi:hypothetical protein [Alkaliphilus crotonatoxidans]